MRFNPRKTFSAVAGAGAMAMALAAAPAALATPVSGAVYTTVNPTIDGSGHCLNGGTGSDAGLVNCNIYDGKEYVWLSGGPEGRTSALADGTYFFAVLVPGGQGSNQNPNDGTEKNLSDLSPTSNTGAGDAWTNRVFKVKDGVISYDGTHDFDRTPDSQSRYGKIRLAGFDDTTSPGGEYVLAVCSLADADKAAENEPGVNPSDCKYDAFKVRTSEDPPAKDLTISKTAEPSFDESYEWDIAKDVDKTLVQQIGGTATFNYTVTSTHDSGTPANWKVTGQVTVGNPNVFDVSAVDVTDKIDNNGSCEVKDGAGITVPGQGQVVLDYTCTYPGAPDPSAGTNTATATWFEGTDKHVSAEALYDFADAKVNKIDECASVSDTYAGTLGPLCVGVDPSPKTFNYNRVVSVPSNDCLSYDNTASFTTNDTGATGSASKTVTVCGPAKTGALTIGFWKNTNGQNLIKTYCVNGGSSLAGYLKGLGGGSGPFRDAPTSNCSDLAKYVSGVLSGASATDMNKMLRAQMLGTALDVWFTGPGWSQTTVNKIKPPSTFLAHNSLGAFSMDTTAVCPMVDNTTAGTATCTAGKPSTNAVTSGAVPRSPMTIQGILDFASTTSDPYGGSAWYGSDRTRQEILKNIYDQFNNQLAFAGV